MFVQVASIARVGVGPWGPSLHSFNETPRPAARPEYARCPCRRHATSRIWDRTVELTNQVGDRLLKRVNRAIARQSTLPVQPFYEPSDFPWVAPLETDWKKIRAELDALLAFTDALPNFQDISTDQYNLTDDDRWKTYFFYGYGFRSDANCARCPETTRLVEAIPGMETAMFSILAPGKRIPPHDGPYKGVLRYHLGLAVPDAPVEQVGIRVGDQIRPLGRGRQPRLRRHLRARSLERHRPDPRGAVPRRRAAAARADANDERGHDQADRLVTVHPGRQAPSPRLGAGVRAPVRLTGRSASTPRPRRSCSRSCWRVRRPRAAGRCR